MLESDGSQIEDAVIARLSENWQRRATVKKDDPALEDFYDPQLADYPLALTPFFLHPDCPNIDPETLDKALFLGALAFHRHTMVIEQRIVEPTFSRVLSGSAPAGIRPELSRAVLQAAVDEQYHTLMHFNAADVMRRNRPWAFAASDLPVPAVVDRHRTRRSQRLTPDERHLVDLAFLTVVEISIDAYLSLVARDTKIQPVTSRTAAMHWRDEVCHASISSELAKHIFAGLRPVQQGFFMNELTYAVEQFNAQDYSTWETITNLAQIRDGRRILAECREIPAARYLMRDNSGLEKLRTELNDIAEISTGTT